MNNRKKETGKFFRFFLTAFFLLLFLCSCADKSTLKNGAAESERDSLAFESITAVSDTAEKKETAEIKTPAESESEAAETQDAVITEETEKARIGVETMSLDRTSVEINAGESTMPMVTMLPENADDKSELWSSDNPSVASVDSCGNITGISGGSCTVTVRSNDNRELFVNVSVHVNAPETEAYTDLPASAQGSASGPTYINGILIANKTYALPADYNPGYDATALSAFYEMQNAAGAEGISLYIVSGFRSYYDQNWIYNNYVAADGRENADRYSARPGHSEHQTGLAYDLNDVDYSFGDTPAGIWLKNNCWKYGFIIRYPEGKESVTGYLYEPWHVRYLGKSIAAAVYESGLCLEEYLGITSVYAD